MSGETVKTDKSELSTFLRQIATDLDNNLLSPQQQEQIGYLFMSFKLMQEPLPADWTEQDWKRYLVTGWYICNFIRGDSPDNSLQSAKSL